MVPSPAGANHPHFGGGNQPVALYRPNTRGYHLLASHTGIGAKGSC